MTEASHHDCHPVWHGGRLASALRTAGIRLPFAPPIGAPLGYRTDLPCPFWRKANNFRELVAFLLSYVATIILANTKLSLDIISYICYYSSHYVCRYLSHHPWWQNVYAASAARVLSCPRQGPSPHDCECEPLFRGGDRSAAAGTATQGGPGAPGDPPGRNHVEARIVFWCGMDAL